MIDNSNGSGPRLSPQVLASAKDFKCEKCEHLYFSPVVALKSVSALLSPTGKDLNFPVQTFACAKCGHVNEEFVPKFS
jgi:hypothetical protein